MPYRKLFIAILAQAVRDLQNGSPHERDSAAHFLLEYGSAYLSFAGITKPEKRLVKFGPLLKWQGKQAPDQSDEQDDVELALRRRQGRRMSRRPALMAHSSE